MSKFNSDKAQRLSRTLKLVADPNRMQALAYLYVNGDTSVGALCSAIGVSQPNLSINLRNLLMVDIVNQRRDGKNMYYSLNKHSEHYSRIRGLLNDVLDDESEAAPKKPKVNKSKNVDVSTELVEV